MLWKRLKKTKRMRQAKRDTLWKEIETEEKWPKKKNVKQTGFTWKKRNNYKKEKQGDTQKGKREKKDEQEKTQQKEMKQEWTENDEKEEDKWWTENKRTKEDKTRGWIKEGFVHTKMKRKWKNDRGNFRKRLKKLIFKRYGDEGNKLRRSQEKWDQEQKRSRKNEIKK